jgi:hypothetical protein
MNKETFFLPDEVSRERWMAPAGIYNNYQKLYAKNPAEHVFLPLRSMQLMAVLEKNKISFVDNLSYAHRDNKGGRIILIAWKFAAPQQRVSLVEPVPCDVIHYSDKNSDLQLRLVAEFRKSLEQMDQYNSDHALPANGATIVPLHNRQ